LDTLHRDWKSTPVLDLLELMSFLRRSPPLCIIMLLMAWLLATAAPVGSCLMKVSLIDGIPFFLTWAICGYRLNITSSNRNMHRVLFW